MKLYVKVENDVYGLYTVGTKLRIGEFKEDLRRTIASNGEQLTLFFEGELLTDEMKFKDIKIEDGGTMDLIIEKGLPTLPNITVNLSSKISLPVSVSMDASPAEVKHQLKQYVDRADEVILLYKGRLLSDQMKLVDCGIVAGDNLTIHPQYNPFSDYIQVVFLLDKEEIKLYLSPSAKVEEAIQLLKRQPQLSSQQFQLSKNRTVLEPSQNLQHYGIFMDSCLTIQLTQPRTTKF